jgi:hypothetical protein
MMPVLDGEIVCLAPDGRSRFYDLLFRREWRHFIAFDALTIEGRDIRGEPLWRRKRQLRRVMPRGESRLLFLDYLQERGQALFEAVCAHACEGIVAKWKRGTYSTDGVQTSWLKIRNAHIRQCTAAANCLSSGAMDVRFVGATITNLNCICAETGRHAIPVHSPPGDTAATRDHRWRSPLPARYPYAVWPSTTERIVLFIRCRSQNLVSTRQIICPAVNVVTFGSNPAALSTAPDVLSRSSCAKPRLGPDTGRAG